MKKSRSGKKLFIVRKFVKARSASEALRLEKKQEPDEVYLDADWKLKGLPNAMGFHLISPEKEREDDDEDFEE